MRKLLALLIVGLMMGISGTANAAGQEINEEYAKNLLQTWVGGHENSCEEVTGAISGLNVEQLKELRALIVEDQESGEGKIIRTDLAPSYRYAGKMRNTIDDMLGELTYDRKVEGELIINDEPATTVSRYDLVTLDGETIKNVMVGTSTIMPRCGFLEEVNVPYRLYLKELFVVKIEELKE